MSDVSVLVLTEDGSKWAVETLEQVCLQIFGVLTPQLDRTGGWLKFEPANEAARHTTRANTWKSTNPKDHRRIIGLCRDIATHISRADGFVFFHVDGDRAWATGKSENVEKFEAVIASKVRDHIRELTKDDAAAFDYRMSKLIRVTPYYAIETWLFANIEQLRKLGAVDPILDAWAADPSLLDRVAYKIELRNIKPHHYPLLAQTMKAEQLYALGTSFCDTVNRTRACSSLITHLRAHWPEWARRGVVLD